MSAPEDKAKEEEIIDESHEIREVQKEIPESDEISESEEISEREEISESEETPDSEEAEELTPAAALEQAREEVTKFRDLALRAEAEMQNMQRRTARDIENAHKFGLERFLQNLLPVVDSLEKAIESAEAAGGEASDAIAEGVTLCHKLLMDVLHKESIEVLDPAGGEPFDPDEHQAMSMVDNPDMEPNSVFAVVQKGYKLNGRLVRAAMVMVTKAPADAENQ